MPSRKLVSGFTPAELPDFIEKEWTNNTDKFYLVNQLMNFFDQLAILVQHGGADEKFLEESLGGALVAYWNDLYLGIVRLNQLEAKRWGPVSPDRTKKFCRHWERLAEKTAEHLGLRFDPMPPASADMPPRTVKTSMQLAHLHRPIPAESLNLPGGPNKPIPPGGSGSG